MDNSTDDLSARADRMLKRNVAKDDRELEATLTEDARASATMTESETEGRMGGSVMQQATKFQ